MSTCRSRISAAELNIGDGAFRAGRDRRHAGERRAEGAVCQSRRLWRPGQWRPDRRCLDRQARLSRCAADLTGVRALPLLRSVADFDKLDGKMQAKIACAPAGTSQRAIMSNLDGTVFAVFQDGAIRGLNVAQMIRSLTSGTLSGWQEGEEQGDRPDAAFGARSGSTRARPPTTDLNLVGPLVKMTGAGTIDLGTKQIWRFASSRSW